MRQPILAGLILSICRRHGQLILPAGGWLLALKTRPGAFLTGPRHEFGR